MGFAIAQFLLPGPRGLQALARYGQALYALFVSVPLVVVLLQGVREGTLAQMGLAWPRVPDLGGYGVPVAVLVAALLGIALYGNELFLSVALRNLLQARGRAARGVQSVMEGQSRTLLTRHSPGLATYMAHSTFISFAEELLWRGFLLWMLLDHLHVGLDWALLVSALLFGVNHGIFGLRNVALKTFDGLVWGAVRVATDSMLLPFISHLVFQYFVWRRLYRMSLKTAPA
jgi:membrane protease YdiL (CAAX protease family)